MIELPSYDHGIKVDGTPRAKGEWRRVRVSPLHRVSGTLVCQACLRTYPAMTYQIRRGQKYCSGACRNSATDVERFWKNVKKTDGCWKWLGAKPSSRYGGMLFGKKHLLAHRISWTLHFGEIPNGMLVCHHCDNGLCVRPDHLFLGTQADNMRDMISKGRKKNRVLTSESKAEILKSEGLSRMELAEKYGVSVRTITDLLRKNRTQ